jgi:hypothetical protein
MLGKLLETPNPEVFMFPVGVFPDVFDSARLFIICSDQRLQFRSMVFYPFDGRIKFRMRFFRSMVFPILMLPKTDFIFLDNGTDFQVFKLPAAIMIVQWTFREVL